MMLRIDHAPCADGEHHTSYVIVDGPKEGEVQPFPLENFQLTSPDHQEKIREMMRRKNVTLVVPP